MKKILVVLIVLASVWSSCGLMKPQIVYVNKDSLVTITNTVIKDSIITIPGDTIRLQIPCDKDTVYIVRGKSSNSTVQVSKGVVTVQNSCDEKDLIITKLKDQISHYEISVSDSSKTEIKIVKHVPVMYKVFTYGFWILATAIAAILLTNNNIWLLVVTGLAQLAKSFGKKKNKQ